jgi:hypothetical protein
MIRKTITSVAKSAWTSVVNVVRKNVDIMKLFSLHMKKYSLTNYNNKKDHDNSNNDHDDNIYNNNDNDDNKCHQNDNDNMNPESDGGTFITNIIDLNSLKSNHIDCTVDFDNPKYNHNNNVDLNNSDNININENKKISYNNNITEENNDFSTYVRANSRISPQPPTLSKPSITTLRQRNINSHNLTEVSSPVNIDPNEDPKNNEISNNNTTEENNDFSTYVRDNPLTEVSSPVNTDPNNDLKKIPLVNITQNNPAKLHTKNQILQKNSKNLIPSTVNTHISPTPPLGIKKRPNRNDLHTKTTSKQLKITPTDNNDEINRKQIKFEDYQNLNIAREFKMHLISNGHRIPIFLQNVVISETAASLKNNLNKNRVNNKDNNNDGNDDDNIVISKIAGSNDENDDGNNHDYNDRNDDDNSIVGEFTRRSPI